VAYRRTEVTHVPHRDASGRVLGAYAVVTDVMQRCWRSLLSAIGRMNAPTLNLAVTEYDRRTHFNQVKGRLWGVRTPDGK